MPQTERRRHARQPVRRPVKLRCAHTGKYLPGSTTNVSSSGALLETPRPWPMLVRGNRVTVGIAWTGRDAVLDSRHMTAATVLRSHRVTGGPQRVAVQFDHNLELALSA